MSVILITNHDENIKNITESRTSSHYDSGLIFSKHKLPERTRIVSSTDKHGRLKKAYATMGLPQESLPDPCNFLKKHTGKLAYTQIYGDTIKASKIGKKARKDYREFPTREEIKEYDRKKREALKTERNFIIENIKTVLKMKPKEPEQRIVLEPRGERKRLIDGLEPIYIKSDVLGKTPKYLQNFIKQREKLYQMQKDAVGVEKPKCHYIRRDEREQLLKGLKHNWEELQKQYQGLPILTDTIPKINRKAKLETELKQLEKDIVLIERHPYIYVYNDNVVSLN